MLAVAPALVSALDDDDDITFLGSFKVGTCITLTQNCQNCSYVNITRIYVSDSASTSTVLFIGQIAMTKNDVEYTNSFCNTSIAGDYTVTGKADLDGKTTSGGYRLKVTPTGDWRGVGFQLMLFITAGILFIVSYTIKNAWFGFASGILFMTVGVYTMIYGFLNITDMYTRAIAYIAIGVGLYITMVAAFEFTQPGGSSSEDEDDEEDDE